MNNLKKVYKHLNKEKLATQKIELALVDDFENQYNSANKLVRNAYNGSFKIESALKSMLKDYDTAGKSFLKANSRYQELENAAEKLGIDLDAKYKNYKSDISNTLKEIDGASKTILRALKMNWV